MKIRDLPEKYVQFLHPVYRPLVTKRPRNRIKVERTPVNRIKRKLFYRERLPRVAPYYCEVCTLNSYRLDIVRRHECSRINESRHIVSFENEVRIAQMGFRSKAKDAWAVMERLPNPQHVKLFTKISVTDGLDNPEPFRRDPVSLRDLCLRKIDLPQAEGKAIPWEENFEPLKTGEMDEWRKKLTVIEKNRRTGESAWQCNICENIFKSYADHDDHLFEGDCLEKGDVEPYKIDPLDPTLSYRLPWKPKKNAAV